MLALLVIPLYLIVSAMCGWSLFLASDRRGPAADRWMWAILAALFLALAASRATGAEEAARQAMKASLESRHIYEDRRSMQLPLTVALTIGIGLAFLFSLRTLRIGRPPAVWRAVRLAIAGGWLMVGLVALRLISLHAIDRLLYRGPHLNWLFDLLATGLVGAGAWLFLRAVPARAG